MQTFALKIVIILLLLGERSVRFLGSRAISFRFFFHVLSRIRDMGGHQCDPGAPAAT